MLPGAVVKDILLDTPWKVAAFANRKNENRAPPMQLQLGLRQMPGLPQLLKASKRSFQFVSG